MIAKAVAFINYKGGVGKTTTCYHIGCALAHFHNKKVLLVDADPQTNLTFLCATPERWEEFKSRNGTIASLYGAYSQGKSFDIRGIVWKGPVQYAGMPAIPNLDLVPSDISLLGIDLDLMQKKRSSTEVEELARQELELRSILRTAMQPLEDEYDYILLDCPPNLYLATQNALATSDSYIVTMIPDHLSTVGLRFLDTKISELNEKLGILGYFMHRDVKQPKMAGIIFVKVRVGGSRIVIFHGTKMDELQSNPQYGSLCFENYTTEKVGYTEASDQACPVFLLPESNPLRAAAEYPKIADEFLECQRI
jgi:chromosome partitioning protein